MLSKLAKEKESEDDSLLPGTHVETDTGVYYWEACKKNPGHPLFIPVKEFCISHLPLKYQNDKVMRCVDSLINLTVKVSAKSVSTQRIIGDKLHKYGGKNVSRTGSGIVSHVEKFQRDVNEPCEGSLDKQKLCARIEIMTACHVVFDDEEVKTTTFHLFYDNEKNTDGIKKLYGNRVLQRDEEKDWCLVECVTYDLELADILAKNLKRLKETEKKLSAETKDVETQLELVASHPHGRSKMITLGLIKKVKSWNPIVEGDRVTYVIPAPSKFPTTDRSQDTECVGIEVDVKFMDMRVEKCNIWMLYSPVKETKKFILSQGGILEPAEMVKLVLELPDGEEQVMDDEKEMEYYMNDLARALYVHVRPQV